MCNSNILGTVWCVKLKLTGLVVRDVELTKRKNLHLSATVSTHTAATIFTTSITTTATKAQGNIINSTANTTSTAVKAKDIKVKNLICIVTKWN